MLGAIVGDVIGSVYEHQPIKTTDFPLFDPRCRATDDSVLTIATGDVLLHGGTYADAYRRYFRQYPDAGYGSRFIQWGKADHKGPYNSYGNGSAMRVSPVGRALDTIEEVRAEARRSAEVTHNHPEGIKGAQAVASAVFLARTGSSKDQIRAYIEDQFSGYDLRMSLNDARRHASFDVTCQVSVPQALLAFLESTCFEHAVRLAISLGGDADTQACIAGAIAEAHYGSIPSAIATQALARLDPPLVTVVARFQERFPCPA